MFIVLVSITAKPEQLDAFKVATLEVGLASSELEKGCRGIQVLQQEDDANHFILNEVFDSRADGMAHLETDHFKKWQDLIKPMLTQPPHATTYIPVS